MRYKVPSFSHGLICCVHAFLIFLIELKDTLSFFFFNYFENNSNNMCPMGIYNSKHFDDIQSEIFKDSIGKLDFSMKNYAIDIIG